MSAMSVAMSLMYIPSGIGADGAITAFATWYRRFGPAINRLGSAVFGVSLILSHFFRFGTDLREIRTFAIRDYDAILMPLNGTGGH